mmetsp:Transcript_15003/g.20994  ORF Transcript_15003/g.20994 Transcript_15003/m.20994 type:complete len:188 (-) Transcript_15003:76-639(-)
MDPTWRHDNCEFLCATFGYDQQTLGELPDEVLLSLLQNSSFDLSPPSAPKAEPEPEPESEPEPEPEPEPEEEFPLPKQFVEAVVQIESMGFAHDRARVIELLIEHHNDLDKVVKKLVKEREVLVNERKVKAKADLMALLDSPFGESVVEKMAELSLQQGEECDMLANFVALVNSGNDLAEAKNSLDE